MPSDKRRRSPPPSIAVPTDSTGGGNGSGGAGAGTDSNAQEQSLRELNDRRLARYRKPMTAETAAAAEPMFAEPKKWRSEARTSLAATFHSFGCHISSELIALAVEYTAPPPALYIEWLMVAAKFVPEMYQASSQSTFHIRVFVPGGKCVPEERRPNKNTHHDRMWPFNWRGNFALRDSAARHVMGAGAAAPADALRLADTITAIRTPTATDSTERPRSARRVFEPTGGDFEEFMQRWIELTRIWHHRMEEAEAVDRTATAAPPPARARLSRFYQPTQIDVEVQRTAFGVAHQTEAGFERFTRLLFEAVGCNWSMDDLTCVCGNPKITTESVVGVKWAERKRLRLRLQAGSCS